jgi:MFS family permease
MLGLIIAFLVVWSVQSTAPELGRHTFRTVVLLSLVPAVLAVVSLAIGARDVPIEGKRQVPSLSLKGFSTPFKIFLAIVCIFELGNSSDAFLVLRAQERGLSVLGVLGMLITFNLVYTLISGPAGAWSDRIGRRRIIVSGWLAYSLIYLGFALAGTGWQVWALYVLYGVYYGLTYGTTRALVADIVRPALRGTAYGVYNAALGLLDFPASLVAGILWQGALGWGGLGPWAPFAFGSALALAAALLMALWLPRLAPLSEGVST